MELIAILNQFTQYQRRAVHITGMRREDVAPIVRYINTGSPHSMILYSELTAAIVDDTIERELLYFKTIGHHVEWKVFSYDQPPTLRDSLKQAGFADGEEEALLVLSTGQLPPKLQRDFGHDIREITDADEAVSILNAVQSRVFGRSEDGWMAEDMRRQLTEEPEYIQFFAAYADGAPVSAAWIFYAPQNPFAGLFGGGTLAEHRGKGYYSALVAARAKAAKQRGVDWLYVDASPMSRPILERIGFIYLASSYPMTYTPPNVSAQGER